MKSKGLIWLLTGAGCGLVLMGLYFLIARAGIPYQDPTPALSARWAAFDEAGSICLCVGGGALAAALAVMLLLRGRP